MAMTVEQQRALAIASAKAAAANGQSPTAGPMGTPQQPSRPTSWGSNDEGLDWATMGGSTKAGAALGGLVDATFNAANGEGFNFTDAYNENLSNKRLAQMQFASEHPIQSFGAKAGGTVIGASALPVIGSGLRGAVATGAAYGGAGGALQDADSIGERAINTAKGAGFGAATGPVAWGIGKGVGAAYDGVADIMRNWIMPAETRGAAEVARVADAQWGPFNAHHVNNFIDKAGPDAVLGDALGERGYALARKAANVSPEARETLHGFTDARKAQQNPRLLRDTQQAAGVPVGSDKTVKELKEEAWAAARPKIGAAYDEARLKGAEIPLNLFDDVVEAHPAVREAFDHATATVNARSKLKGEPGGTLAILDEAKRYLNAKAGNYQDPDRGIYGELANTIADRTDKLIMGPEYSEARSVFADATRAQEAFDIGETLGKQNIPINAPRLAGEVDPRHAPNIAAAYAQTKAGRLSNNNNTQAALNEFLTPMGKQATGAALGANGQQVDKGVAREKLYNRFANTFGNSTTARQMAEMAAGSGLLTGFMTGGDLKSMSLGALAGGLVNKFGPRMTTKITNAGKSAPSIAEHLTSRGGILPAEGPSLKGFIPDTLSALSASSTPTNIAKILTMAASKKNRDEDIASQFGGPK